MIFRKRNTSPLLHAATTFLIVSALCVLTPHSASATPQFAKETGKACTQCHQDAKGGKALTPFGTTFQANGNKLPATDSKAPPKSPPP